MRGGQRERGREGGKERWGGRERGEEGRERERDMLSGVGRMGKEWGEEEGARGNRKQSRGV